MHSLESFITATAKLLPTGGSSPYLTCPICGRTKKFGITKFQDCIKYQCFSTHCYNDGKPTRGIIPLKISKEEIKLALDRTTILISRPKEFNIPDHFIQGFANGDALALAIKYDILTIYQKFKNFKTATDVRTMRQVFFYTDLEGRIVGATGRALLRGFYKAHIYEGSTKTPWIIPIKDGESPPHSVVPPLTAVIVEDIFSAIRAFSCGFTGIALSGTQLQEDWWPYFRGYKKIIVALDKDATLKSIGIKKNLQLISNDVRICILGKDLKDCSTDETTEILTNVL